MKYDEATKLLETAWTRRVSAAREVEAARAAYYEQCAQASIETCSHCGKPMPDYDTSQNCDGCHLGWGWATPEARNTRRKAEIDAKIAALQAEKTKL